MKFIRTLLPVGFLILFLSAAQGAEKFVPGDPPVAVHSRVESIFSTLLQKKLRAPDDPKGFEAFARSRGVDAQGFSVDVEILAPAGSSAVSREVLESFGFSERVRSLQFIEGTVPIPRIFDLADSALPFAMIRRIRRPKPAAVSEGVNLLNANVWQGNGSTGSGVKIAVIDWGFSGASSAASSGELGTYTSNDFTSGTWPGTPVHGTACAEIIYDIAPQATYYLLLVSSIAEVQNAATYCQNNGIDIVSFSLGWNNDNFCDGGGTLCSIVNTAAANGILWCGAAGNEGINEYWIGNWSDTNTDNLIEFSGTDQDQDISCVTGETIWVTLTWDNSTTSSEDYDLELWDSTSSVATSTNVQSGTQQPYEQISYLVPAAGTYRILIRRASASGTSQFRLHCTKTLQFGASASSLSCPADATGSFSVGAIDQANWGAGTIQPFSSRGPTLDGRTKPDICGPDTVTTFSYGLQAFPGTSAATPHVAGLAALYLEILPASTPAQIRSGLEGWATDIGLAGKDNTFGVGKARLDTTPPVADFSAAPLTAQVGETVFFTDASTGLVNAWSWDYGDGGTSTTMNPSYAYATPGVYPVALTVTGPPGSDTETKTGYITITPKADFSATPLSGPGELSVSFTDTTAGAITSWSWDFGDTGTSTERNPTHVYTSLGTFTVTLTIGSAVGGDSEVKTDYISVEGPDAAFSGTPGTGPGPLTVQFTDETIGTVTSWNWDFGDSQTSTDQNPSHQYTSNGPFTVTLTVDGVFGSDVDSRAQYVTVTAPVVNFFGSPVEGTETVTVNFMGSVFGEATTYLWDFGDGGSSTVLNPVYEYTSPGTYDVTFSVTSPYGPNSETKTAFVTVHETPPPSDKKGGSCSPVHGSMSAASFLGTVLPFFILVGCVCMLRRRKAVGHRPSASG